MITAKFQGVRLGVAMRRLLLAAVMFGVVSGATAADMPDFLRGSLPAGPVPTVNWQGFYIGAQAGYGSSDENFSGSNSTMLAALLSNNVVEEMGVSQWNLGLGKNSARAPGYGAFTGYNWQWDDVVIGVEASYLHGSFGGKSSAFKAPLGNANITRSVLVTDAVSTTALGVFTPLQPLSADDTQHNHLIYGYTAGLGVDVNLVGGLFLRAEWEYIRFTTVVDTNINTVRAGLGYKF